MKAKGKCRLGHKFGTVTCTCTMVCCQIDPARSEEIRTDARSGTNWASESSAAGPACLCGMRPPRICHRHPERNAP